MDDGQLNNARNLIDYVREIKAPKDILIDADYLEAYLDGTEIAHCNECGKKIDLNTEAFYPEIIESEDEEGYPVLTNDGIDEPHCEECSQKLSLKAQKNFDAKMKARALYIGR